MLPPPGLEPALGATASLISTAISTASSLPSPLITSIVAVSTAIASQDSTSTASKPSPDNGECSLLGPFAILVQGALGCMALLALVYKRWRERPQRPLKIWVFDVSKQVVGSVLVHIANLLMSMLSSGQFTMKLDASVAVRAMNANGKYRPNPCSFYLLNLAIDVSPTSLYSLPSRSMSVLVLGSIY